MDDVERKMAPISKPITTRKPNAALMIPYLTGKDRGNGGEPPVVADYDVNRELAVEMLDYYNRDRAQKQLAFIGLLNAMKRATTAAEWQVVARFQLDHFNPHALVYAPAPGGG